MTKKGSITSPFSTVLPDQVKVGRDKLQLRLDFYQECCVLQEMDSEAEGSYRIIDPHDIVKAFTREVSFTTGFLPPNTLWWTSSRTGPMTALWVEPGVRRLALVEQVGKPPIRLDVPLPGLIFICQPGRAPYVFAASRRPQGPKERVYRAPFSNTYRDGRTCAGSNKYPDGALEIVESFFQSFFTTTEVGQRSKKYPRDITQHWYALDKEKAKTYPLTDLVYYGIVGELTSKVSL